MLTILRTLYPYLIRYRWRYAAGFAALAGKTATAAALPFVIGFSIDRLTGDFGWQSLLNWVALLLGLALVKAALQYWMRWLLIGISRDIEYEIRSDLFAHLIHLSRRFYQSYRTGDLMSRATNDMNAVRLLLGPGIMYSAEALLTFVVVLAVMSATDWRLTCLVFLPIPLVTFSVSYFGRQIHDRFQTVQEKFAEISSAVQENLANVRIVKAFTQEEHQIGRFRVLNEEYVEENLQLIRLWGKFYPLLELLIGLTYALVIWYGGRQVLAGSIAIGDFVMFMLYLGLLTWPMIGLGWVVNIVQRGVASLGRLNELLQQRSEISEPANPGLTSGDIRGDLTFDNVTFTYPGLDKPALSDVSFYVPAGQMLAILGPTGSGKTTLMSLVPRVMDAQHGSVLIDGVDVRAVSLGTLREIVGLVPQDTFLFSRKMRDNIALRSPVAEDWEVFEAAETADIARDIAGFPRRFDTLVGERGIMLSGGQKQRTTIARAILKTPRILILDDATSSVDTLTEETILTNLRTMRRNRTTLIVTHRVSTARQADRILVMSNGRVVESGRHEDLLALGGYYAQLYRKQLIEAELERV